MCIGRLNFDDGITLITNNCTLLVEPLYETKIWRKKMSRNLYQNIHKFWHFADNERPLNYFDAKMRSMYTPNKDVCRGVNGIMETQIVVQTIHHEQKTSMA